MSTTIINHPERLFPIEPAIRDIAAGLYESVRNLPIVSPHGHTDPSWFALNEKFPDAYELLVKPDHYLVRMLYSQGISMESLGITRLDGEKVEANSRKCWRIFAENYHLFAGTPSRLWLDFVFDEVFELQTPLGAATADEYFDHINECLGRPEFRPRALFDRFNIEVLATTESPLDSLQHHKTIRQSDWQGRVITAYRPDPVVDPEFEGFPGNIEQFGEITGEDTYSYTGYLAAHRKRRLFFQSMGATSTDHGHPTAVTADLDRSACEALYQKALEVKNASKDILISFDDPVIASLQEYQDTPLVKGSTCGKLSLHLRPNGDMTPCGFIPLVIGNIIRDDFETVWNESEVLQAMRHKSASGKCTGCGSYEDCLGGCSARAFMVTGDFNAPDPHCWK